MKLTLTIEVKNASAHDERLLQTFGETIGVAVASHAGKTFVEPGTDKQGRMTFRSSVARTISIQIKKED